MNTMQFSQRHAKARRFLIFSIAMFILLSRTTVLAQGSQTFYANSVAWSPDGDKIAVGGGPEVCDPDNPSIFAIRIYDVLTGQLETSLTESTCTVTMVDWSHDGTKLVASSLDVTGVRVWDVNSGQVVMFDYIFAGQGVTAVRWSPDGTKFASGGVGNSVIINDGFTGEQLVSASTGGTLIDWSDDGSQLVTGSAYENGVYTVDATTGQQRLALSGHTNGISSVDWSPDGRYIASTSGDASVKIWDATSGQSILNLTGFVARYVRWNPNSDTFAVVSVGDIQIWDVNTGNQIASIPTSPRNLTVDWSPDGERLAYFDNNRNELQIVTLASVMSTQTSMSPEVPRGNGRIAFAANVDGNWEIYTINPDGSDLLQLTDNTEYDRFPAWSPDGTQIVFVRDGDIYLMNADGAEQQILLETSNARHPSWSPDGTKILFEQQARNFTDIFILDIPNMTVTNVTNTRDELDGSPTWSPDGNRIAFASSGSHLVPRPIDGDPVMDIFTINSDGTDRAEISITGFGVGNLNWTADNNVVFSVQDIRSISIFSVPVSGGDIIRISEADTEVSSNGPTLSPDGQKVAFLRGNQILTMDTDGSNVEILADFPFRISHLSWQPVDSSLGNK
jgi:Tol biopolymer transport system component